MLDALDWLAVGDALGHDFPIMRRSLAEGTPWREASAAAYGHQGSCGNGAAMRVAPLGAYFAGGPERIAAEAVRSAEVTHLHPEGIAGAVAVALAAGRAAHARLTEIRPDPDEFICAALEYLNDGETTRLIRHARTLLGACAERTAAELGNGYRVTAQNTVPFTIWVAGTHLDDYPTAVSTCIAADGDIDTTSAIAGGIVTSYTGSGRAAPGGVPPAWLTAREPLPPWLDAAGRTRRAKSRRGRIRRWSTGGQR